MTAAERDLRAIPHTLRELMAVRLAIPMTRAGYVVAPFWIAATRVEVGARALVLARIVDD